MQPLYYLSCFGSIRDLWTAKVYVLSVFIAVTNAFWPYFRVALLIYVMAVPGISHKWSARIQLFCDTLGKWMTAQALVLVLMMVWKALHHQRYLQFEETLIVGCHNCAPLW